MHLELGGSRIYRCPFCGVDTPHTVQGRRRDTYGITCTHCNGGTLVGADELHLYQARWEEELRSILENLGGNDLHPSKKTLR